MKFISLLLFFFTLASYSQQNPEVYISEYHRLWSNNKDSAQLFSDQLINSKNLNKKVFGYAGKAHLLAMSAEYEKSDELFDISVSLMNKNEDLIDKEVRGNLIHFIARRYMETHELDLVIESVNEGLKLCENDCSDFLILRLRYILGRAYALSKNHREAIQICRQSLAQLKGMRDFEISNELKTEYLKQLVILFNWQINYYLEDKMKNLSYLDSVRSSAAIAKDFSLKHQITTYNGNLEIIYADIHLHAPEPNYKVSQQYLKRGLEIYQKENHKKRVEQIKYNLAKTYFFSGKMEEAKVIFHDQIDRNIWSEFQLLNHNAKCHFYLFKIYEEQEDIKKALFHAKEYAKKMEEYLTVKSQSDMSVNEAAQIKNKEEEIKGYIDNYEQQKKQKETYVYLFSGLFVIAVFGSVYFISIKRRDKRNISQLNERIAALQMHVSKKDVSNKNSGLSDKNALKLIEKLKALEEEELFLQPNYTLNKVAKKLKTNSTYLSETVNKYLHMPFAEYTNRLRINSILRKLKEEKHLINYTIQGLAQEAGYKSASSFNRNFKKYLKITPTQYLNELKRV